MSNGLDKLNGMRTKGAGVRKMPAPRNGPRATPVELTAADDGGRTDDALTAQESAASPANATAAAGPSAHSAQAPAPVPVPRAVRKDEGVVPDKLEKATIYLDEPTDSFLEDVIAAGRRQKPRIDSRSAIVRLALRELADKMSPEEVVAAIRATTKSSPGAQGRPRL